MKVSRSRFIVDSNVLRGLNRGGIVEQFFALPYAFVAPDVIITDELLVPNGRDLERMGLLSAELSGDQVQEVEFLWGHNLEIAVNDIFALVLASHTGSHS